MVARDLLGFALFCAGATSVAFAGGRYAVGEWQRQEARRSWEQSEALAVVALARGGATTYGNALPVAPGAVVARLLVPRLQMDEIVIEGVDDNALNAGPGHLPGSAYPGERGNSVISAHRDRHFARLGDIQVGDTVVTESRARREHWVVVSKRVIDADAPALFRTTDATLTLTTCWPIRSMGTAPERLLVTAKPVQSHTPQQTASFVSAGTT